MIIWELSVISHKHFVLISECTNESAPQPDDPRPAHPDHWGPSLGVYWEASKPGSFHPGLFIYFSPLNSESKFVVAMRCNAAGILQKD